MTYFKEALEVTGSQLLFSTRAVSLCRSLHLFSKLRRRVIYTAERRRGKGGAPRPRLCVSVRACEENARINRPIASDSADDGDITNADNLAFFFFNR